MKKKERKFMPKFNKQIGLTRYLLFSIVYRLILALQSASTLQLLNPTKSQHLLSPHLKIGLTNKYLFEVI